MKQSEASQLGPPERSGRTTKRVPLGTEMCPSPSERQALLIFADSLALDLARRRWPRSFACLLQMPLLQSGWKDHIDVHLFTRADLGAGEARRSITVHRQEGTCFAERLENAIDTLAELGYSRVVIIGRDCPDLQASDIQLAFQLLESHRLVIGPDHRGGCYLIGFHSDDQGRLKTIQWQENTDCRELQSRFGSDRTFLLPFRYDLDNFSDVRLLAGSRGPWQAVAEFLIKLLEVFVSASRRVWVDTGRQRERTTWQLPPPSCSAPLVLG